MTTTTTTTTSTAAQRRRLRFGDILKKHCSGNREEHDNAAVIEAKDEMLSPAATPPLRRSIVFDKQHSNRILKNHEENNPNTKQQFYKETTSIVSGTRTTPDEVTIPETETTVQPQVIRVKINPATPILQSVQMHHPNNKINNNSKYGKIRPSIEFVCFADSPTATERSTTSNTNNNNISALTTTTTATMDLLQGESVADAVIEQFIQETKHEVIESMSLTWSLECIQQCHDPMELQEKITILEQPSNREIFPGLLRAAKERLLQLPMKHASLQPIVVHTTNAPTTTPVPQLLLRASQRNPNIPCSSTSPRDSHRSCCSNSPNNPPPQKQQQPMQAAATTMQISTTSSSFDMSLSYSETENYETGVDSMEKSHSGPQNVSTKNNNNVKTMTPTPRKNVDTTALIRCHVAAIERLTHTIVEMRATNEELQRQLQELRSVHAIQEKDLTWFQSSHQNLENLQEEWRSLIGSLQKLTDTTSTSDWRVLIKTLKQRHSIESSKLEELTRRADHSERQLLAVRSELESARRQWSETFQQTQNEKSNLLHQIQQLQCDQNEFHDREQAYRSRIRRLQQLVATAAHPENNTIEYYRSRPKQSTQWWWLHHPAAPQSQFASHAAEKTNPDSSSIMTGTIVPPPSPNRSATAIHAPIRPKTPAPFRVMAAETNANLLVSPSPTHECCKPSDGKENEHWIPPTTTSKDNNKNSCQKDPLKNKAESSHRRALAVISSGGRLSLYQKLQETRRSPRPVGIKPPPITLEKLNIRPVIR
jgi:hypothetical protein